MLGIIVSFTLPALCAVLLSIRIYENVRVLKEAEDLMDGVEPFALMWERESNQMKLSIEELEQRIEELETPNNRRKRNGKPMRRKV